MTDLDFLPAWKLRALFVARELSPLDYARHVLGRVAATEPVLHAFITIDEEQVLAQARRAEQALYAGDPLGPLHGVPVSIKDSIPTGGLRTTWGSLLFADFVPREDAVVAARVRQSGAIVLGKTSASEFQLVGRTKNRLIPECASPWDVTRSAGGSSGGAAASVASGSHPISIGGDDGGSIRLPAAYNGLIGVCPSAGRIPRLAAPAEAPPPHSFPGHLFQNIGPMARDVRDAALMLKAIAGPHPSDPYAMAAPPAGWLDDIDSGVAGLRLAWIGFEHANPASAVEAEISAASRDLAAQGAELDEPGVTIRPPMTEIGPLYGAYLGSFFRAITADPAQRQLLSPYVSDFVAMAHNPLTPAQEQRGWAARRALIDQFNTLFQRYDLLLSITVGHVAPVIKDAWDLLVPTTEYAACTNAINVTGLAAMSVPAGFVDGLPVGLQLIAPRGGETTLFRAARTLEQTRSWARHWPAIV